MAATVKAELTSWWDTFGNGLTADQGEEEEPEPVVEVDSDSDFERVAAGEEARNAAAASDGKMAAPHARVDERRLPAGRQCKEEYNVEDNYARTGGGLMQGMKREATMTLGKLQPTAGTEIHGQKCSGYKKDRQVAAYEGENKGVAASEMDGQMTAAAQGPVQPSRGGMERHCDEEYVPGNCYVQLPGGLLGRKRKAIVTHAEPQTTRTEIQDQKGEYIQTGVVLQGRKREAMKLQTTTGHGKAAQGECLRAENETLRLQLVSKTEEIEAEKIRRVKLELNLKNKEINSLEKQNEVLRAENDGYRKRAKPRRSPRLFHNEYGLSVATATIGLVPVPCEQDEGDDSY